MSNLLRIILLKFLVKIFAVVTTFNSILVKQQTHSIVTFYHVRNRIVFAAKIVSCYMAFLVIIDCTSAAVKGLWLGARQALIAFKMTVDRASIIEPFFVD
jgi:membrane-associated HD superfamily phosphohydrolase